MLEPVTKEYLDEKIDTVLRTVKNGFDAVDQHFILIEGDLAHVRERLSMLENEVRALSANMVTKQYLDAKVEQLQVQQQKDSLFKRSLLLALEQAKVLAPDVRAKLEMLIA